jgi:hypothetical protein
VFLNSFLTILPLIKEEETKTYYWDVNEKQLPIFDQLIQLITQKTLSQQFEEYRKIKKWQEIWEHVRWRVGEEIMEKGIKPLYKWPIPTQWNFCINNTRKGKLLNRLINSMKEFEQKDI